jgi:dihydrofolate reductase
MRRLVAFIVTTLDGYHEGADGEFDWPVVDEEFYDFSVEQLDTLDMVLFGRRTYLGMASYWPTPAAAESDARIAPRMNAIEKGVVSRTLGTAEWGPTRVFRSVDELAALKQEPGGEIAIFGSSTLTASVLAAGLLDELRVMVHPVLLGAGNSLVSNGGVRTKLALTRTREFDSGNVLLYYEPLKP